MCIQIRLIGKGAVNILRTMVLQDKESNERSSIILEDCFNYYTTEAYFWYIIKIVLRVYFIK